MNAKKYKSNQAGHVLHHSWKNWERQLNNETIDHSKNDLNYQIFNSVRSGEPLKAEHIQEAKDLIKKETGRSVRKDAVVVASIVVTKPPNVPESDELDFFEQSYAFFRERLLKAGLDLSNSHLTGFVHMNETTPHMHLQFIPIQVSDKGHKLNAKNIISRSLLQTMHKDLTDHLEKELHYRPELLIDEEHSIDKMLGRYDLDNKDYQKVKNALTADLRREKEYLRQDIGREKQAITEIDDSIQAAKIESSAKEATQEIRNVQGLIQHLRERAERIRGFIVGVLGERSQSKYKKPATAPSTEHLRDRVRTISATPRLNEHKKSNHKKGHER